MSAARTMYDKGQPLGPHICTGGPFQLAMTFGFRFDREFYEAHVAELASIGANATHGCSLIDPPIDAPILLPAGSTIYTWTSASSTSSREGDHP